MSNCLFFSYLTVCLKFDRILLMKISPEQILLKLLDSGFDAFYVGGCVRDKLRGVKSDDVDVATNAKLADIKKLFPRSKIVGEAFSVAIVDKVEVATFRQDGPYSDFRHPDYVKFVSSIEEDLSRRDFTINAMAENVDGKIIDLFGGQQDLNNKIIKFVGEPELRISEDPIRALRACRFAALIGGEIETFSKKAIIKTHHFLGNVARERVQLELNKILKLENCEAALFMLSDLKLLPNIFSRLSKSIDFPQNHYHAEDCWVHAVKATQAIKKKNNLKLLLAGLLHDVAKPFSRVRGEDGLTHFYGHEIKGEKLVEEELRNLKYSKEIIEYVKEGTRFHMSQLMFVRGMKDSTVRRLMSKLKYIPVRDLVRLQIADIRGNLKNPFTFAEQKRLMKYALGRIREVEKKEYALKISDLAIDGKDVMEILGLPAGREVGEKLKFCFEKVLQNPKLNERKALLEIVASENL